MDATKRKNAHLAAECYQFRQELFATKAKLEEQVKGEMSSMSTDSAKLAWDRQARAESKVDDFKQKAQQQHEKEKLKAATSYM